MRGSKMHIPHAIDKETPRAVKVGVRVSDSRGRDNFDFKGTGFAVVRKGRIFVVCNEHTVRRILDQFGLRLKSRLDSRKLECILLRYIRLTRFMTLPFCEQR